MRLLINTILFYKYMKNEKYIYAESILLFLLFINVISLNFFYLDCHLVLSILMIASIIDIKTYTIPNFISFSILIVAVITSKYNIGIDLIISFTIILFLFFFSYFKNSIGMGDIKLLISILLYLGGEVFILFLFILSVTLFISSIFIILKKIDIKRIPMVPFITISYILIGVLI